MVHVLLYIVEHGGEGVGVGGAVDIEGATDKVRDAVGDPELVGAGHVLPFEVVGGAVEAVGAVQELVLIDARGEGEVALDKLVARVDLGAEVLKAVDVLIGEEDVAFVLGVRDCEPLVGGGVLLPLHL